MNIQWDIFKCSERIFESKTNTFNHAHQFIGSVDAKQHFGFFFFSITDYSTSDMTTPTQVIVLTF